VENLAYALPYQSILQPLSFEVAAGEIVLVTGASGVGKTLLLAMSMWRIENIDRSRYPSSAAKWPWSVLSLICWG
jgi:energy-coupling factor transporter ATP-binding protein EcfA2